MHIRIHGNVSATWLVLLGGRCPGNVFTESFLRERAYRAVAPGRCLPSRCPGNLLNVRFHSLYNFSADRIGSTVSQKVRNGVRVWPGVFASLPEQRRAFLLVYIYNWECTEDGLVEPKYFCFHRDKRKVLMEYSAILNSVKKQHGKVII
jgi:hypothetical protein